MDSLTERGVAALRAGDAAAARALLGAAVRQRPDDARAWLWLSGAVGDPAQQRYCLERALALDPGSEAARRGLEALGGVREGGPQITQLSGPPGGEGEGDPQIAQMAQIARISRPEAGPEGLHAARRGLPLRAGLPWLAAALAGVSALLGWAAWSGLGAGADPRAVLWAALLGGAPLGLAALVLGGVLLRTSGRWLGGVAGAAEVRAALGWAAAPAACGVILWGLQLALLPAASLGGGADSAQLSLARAAAAAHAALWLWSAARGVTGVAAAHAVGPARAAAAWLLAALIVVGAAFAVLGGSAVVIGLRGG